MPKQSRTEHQQLWDRDEGRAVSERPYVRWAALGAAIGLAGLAAFQLALAAGAPLGHAAWGGIYTQLPIGLRIGSAVTIVVFGLAALLVLRRAGFPIRWISAAVARRGVWAFLVILPLSAVANFLSQSPWERYVLGPIALILATLFLIVARGADRPVSA
jgi:hypothetical protein